MPFIAGVFAQIYGWHSALQPEGRIKSRFLFWKAPSNSAGYKIPASYGGAFRAMSLINVSWCVTALLRAEEPGVAGEWFYRKPLGIINLHKDPVTRNYFQVLVFVWQFTKSKCRYTRPWKLLYDSKAPWPRCQFLQSEMYRTLRKKRTSLPVV